jgi:hypothetical protein
MDSVGFDLWRSDIGSLIQLSPPGSRQIQIAAFDEVDESALHSLEHGRIDKDCLQRHFEKQKLEFGKGCEELVLRDFSDFQVVKSTKPKESECEAPPANPYTYCLDDNIEVDFYAKKESEAIAGMFQLTMPEQEKLDTLE